MDYLILIFLGLIFLGPIIGIVIGVIIGLFRGNTNHVSNYQSDLHNNSWMGFYDDSHDDGHRNSRSYRTPSTIIGKAASTGRMKTMMDMMTGMTDFGTKGNFDSVFSYSVFQLL